jgi:gluconate 2-dehydrogenase gamma chain
MRQIGISPSRRLFLRRALAIAPAAVAVGHEIAHPAPVRSAPLVPVQAYEPTYFSVKEWALLSALVDRLIPADDEGAANLERAPSPWSMARIERDLTTKITRSDLCRAVAE